ncbi:MAG: four-helix bundle copper-binding protein [Candidatus Hydrogenedentes bacterium]|nr:four-helix bundle copper-binding protein [Candidatus Hydrogenedentota bacterium]
MSRITEMMKQHAQATSLDIKLIDECIEICFECAEVTAACADICLGSPEVDHMRACIRTCLDASEVCSVTARMLVRQTEQDWRLARTMLGACSRATSICGDECGSHADHGDHHRLCAETCRRCDDLCRSLLEELPAKA